LNETGNDFAQVSRTDNFFLFGGDTMSTIPRLNPSLVVASAVMTLAVLATPVLAAGNKHVSEAVAHAKEAVSHGKQGHADALAKHAEAALKQAEMARKDLKNNPHIDESIKGLEDAILQAKEGHAEKGTAAAEGALVHLAEVK
jgi:hypothetical protein